MQVSEEILQAAAEALSHTGVPRHSDTQETVRKMAAMKFEYVYYLSFFSPLDVAINMYSYVFVGPGTVFVCTH